MPLGKYYILRGHQVVEVDDFLEAAMFLENVDARTVCKTPFAATSTHEACEVSTVFLTIDHSHVDHGPPIVFETLVFGGPMADWMRRYATWDEAAAGHEETVELVAAALRGEQPPPEDVAKKYERPTWHQRVLKDEDDL